VKAANILLTSEAEVKIADFGISDSVGKTSDSIGTPLWMVWNIDVGFRIARHQK
jgi:serine/threonine protein kinase